MLWCDQNSVGGIHLRGYCNYHVTLLLLGSSGCVNKNICQKIQLLNIKYIVLV